MYSLTINGIEAGDKILLLCAMLGQKERYLRQAEDLESLKSPRPEVAKLVESYRRDAAEHERIIQAIYNARTE